MIDLFCCMDVGVCVVSVVDGDLFVGEGFDGVFDYSLYRWVIGLVLLVVEWVVIIFYCYFVLGYGGVLFEFFKGGCKGCFDW